MFGSMSICVFPCLSIVNNLYLPYQKGKHYVKQDSLGGANWKRWISYTTSVLLLYTDMMIRITKIWPDASKLQCISLRTKHCNYNKFTTHWRKLMRTHWVCHAIIIIEDNYPIDAVSFWGRQCLAHINDHQKREMLETEWESFSETSKSVWSCMATV